MIQGCKHGPTAMIPQPCPDCERERAEDAARVQPILERLAVLRAEDGFRAVAQALDDFQRLYEKNTYDSMPGNHVYAAKLMAIVEAARVAISLASRTTPEGTQVFTLEQFHNSGCPAVADDESGYEHLADAGMCVCGAFGRAVEKLNELANALAASRTTTTPTPEPK